jgi:hypothetical protein
MGKSPNIGVSTSSGEVMGMLKLLSYLCKRDGITSEEFVDYYENRHVPLILSLAPAPAVYKRHYVLRGDSLNIGEASIDFDVVTEQQWDHRNAFRQWMDAVTGGMAGERVGEDEARFLNRSRTRACVVTDYVTTPPASTVLKAGSSGGFR